LSYPVKLSYILRESGLCKSAAEARRQIQGGAVRLDGRVLQVGKKAFCRLVVGTN
jgi:tyrosyl-tRNA synthetase